MATSSSYPTSNHPNGELKDQIKSIVKTLFENSVKSVCSEEDLKNATALSEGYPEYIAETIVEKVENPSRDKKLQILYNHEKHFLDILRDYKEEIKFASSLQAEIRKEEATFFTSTLKEVYTSLKEAQVDPKLQAQWIVDLVSSYTSSLKLSSRLAEEHVIALIGEVQKEVAETIDKD
ncbi:hypothetical protein [Porphyromonas gingivalis]|uniref:hypothetical protein n=1 Tax=Porphyromonas gingivalis TaxID=837 RepID=UPI000BE77241|nr:hypothetical protein [Porphyromonas gingivalis]PDP41151.1 hypothetical protein CLI84_06710 [Porphyromonas gingivalis]